MRYFLFSSLTLLSSLSIAENESKNKPTVKIDSFKTGLEEVLVTGGKDVIQTLSGSAHILDKEQLQKFDYTDLNNVLTQVPGVYIRYEDGFGLRPNIGIRGATSERSQKITIMEDGILITPAPYSAPAAYYIPNVSRMQAFETFKGPASIKFGPNTVGGAINMATRIINDDLGGELDIGVGDFGYRNLRAFYGENFENRGYWVEALQFGSDGFKELDTSGDTGFVRNDVNAKFQWRSDKSAQVRQVLDVKLGYADEDSDETYLGLTDDDFAINPNRRYAASQLDRFVTEHSQLHFLYSADFNKNFSLNIKAYVNDFDRAWNRFNGFINGIDPSAVLASPDVFFREIQLIRGEVDSNGSDQETLDITNNDRSFRSQGIEVSAQYLRSFGNWNHDFEFGIRLHNDYVERNHEVAGFLIQNSRLVSDGIARDPRLVNRGETDALALFFIDSVDVGNWKFNFGTRFETIDGSLQDFSDPDNNNDNSQSVVIPGAGAFYQLTDHLGLLAGINRGFSPSGPSAAEDVEPEESVNIEYGFRYNRDNFSTEVIGFFSDYDNLLGRCRASDPGCEVGDEFNGGNVEVGGVEWVTNYTHQINGSLMLPVSLVYTYTETAFQNSFVSNFSQWGAVVEGDELPYVPQQVARFDIGLEHNNWNAYLGVRHTGEMREVAGQGNSDDGFITRSLTTLDVSAAYNVKDNLSVQIKIDNLTDEQEIVSRRPFGARPNLPLTVSASVKYRF